MKLRKIMAPLLVAAALCAFTGTTAFAFSDTDNHPSQNAIKKWSEEYSIILGYPDGTFRPDYTITRGEFATVLDRFLQYSVKSPADTFSDTSGLWCEAQVLKLNAAGVMYGASGRAMVQSNLTREQAVTMIVRAFNIPESLSSMPYDDQKQISQYARGGVAAMTERGYLTGRSFRPKQAITRSEVLSILDHMIKTLWQTSDPFGGKVDGTLMLTSKNGAYLESAAINGNLIIGPGVTGTITLNNCSVRGAIINLGNAQIVRQDSSTDVPSTDPQLPADETFTYYGKQIPVAKNVPLNRFMPGDFVWNENGRLTCNSAEYKVRFGIDVSHYQNKNTPGRAINWNAVAADGVDFAYIRLAYRGYGTGRLVQDEYAYANVRGSLAAGIETGGYVFSQAVSEAEAVEEAEFALNLLGGMRLNGPIIFDWELGNASYRVSHVDRETATAAALAFCRRIEQAGYRAMIYCGKEVAYTKYDLSKLREYPLWYPEYEKQNAAGSRPDFHYQMQCWQYTDSASIAGIGGRVDANLELVPAAKGTN